VLLPVLPPALLYGAAALALTAASLALRQTPAGR
jgi:hypothetical protein